MRMAHTPVRMGAQSRADHVCVSDLRFRCPRRGGDMEMRWRSWLRGLASPISARPGIRCGWGF